MTRHVTPPSLAALRARFATLFGNPPPTGMRAAILSAAIAWKEQVLVHGDIEPAIARDLAVIARECRERRLVKAQPATTRASRLASAGDDASPAGPVAAAMPPPLPPASSQLGVGARLVRTHAGVTHVVEVTGEGFVHDGVAYRSLSAVARAITGTHWNGLLFFGLRRRKTPGGSTSRKRATTAARQAAHG